MNLRKHTEEVKMDLQISPLIDVVFLLLIYFIVTTELIKKEADVQFMLPAKAEPQVMPTLPVEVVVMISKDGAVEVSGVRYASNDEELLGLVTQMQRLQAMAKSQRERFFVNLLPDKEALHSRIIDVMDACAEAEVENLSFSKSI